MNHGTVWIISHSEFLLRWMVITDEELDLKRGVVLPRLEGGMVETPARILATNQ